jgi:hypothetical protein
MPNAFRLIEAAWSTTRVQSAPEPRASGSAR